MALHDKDKVKEHLLDDVYASSDLSKYLITEIWNL